MIVAVTAPRYRAPSSSDLSASVVARATTRADKSEEEGVVHRSAAGRPSRPDPGEVTTPATPLERAAFAAGVLRRDRAAAFDLTRSAARQQVAARRWTTWGDHVLLMQNGEPTRWQMMWIAVTDVGWPAALASHTALELAGFRGFATEAAHIHLLIPRGSRCAALPGVRIHESRRLQPGTLLTDSGPPRTDPARSVLDAAAWQPYPRFACAMVAAVVQQRLCSVSQLDAAMASVGRIRHKAYLRLALLDVRSGAHAAGELDVASMCRRYGLPFPRRQVRRRDGSGRLRYLDCEWDLPDGGIVVLEVDGRHHLDVASWESDLRRERSVVLSGRRVLRATNLELRLEPAVIATDLVAIGVPSTRLAST